MAVHIWNSTILVILAASLVLAGEQSPSPSSPRDSGSEAKSYSIALGRVEVALRPDKPEVMIGEPVYLSFTVRNLSDSDLQSVQGGDYQNRFGRPESYAVTVADRNGEALPVLDAGPSFGGIMGPQKIPAKGTWVRRLFLPHWVKLAAAGDYTVTCKMVLKLSRHTPGNWDHNEKTIDTKVEVSTQL